MGINEQKYRILALARNELRKIRRKSQRNVDKKAEELLKVETSAMDPKEIARRQSQYEKYCRIRNDVQGDLDLIVEWMEELKEPIT